MVTILLILVQSLTGQITGLDIAQDIYGFRALVQRIDPYPILGQAYATMGIEWNITHASTHPPTAFLFTAPVAFLPGASGVTVWAWLMVTVIIASLRLYGIQWKWIAIGLPALLLFPPVPTSLGQLTPLWLLGTALAYRNREKPIAAGAWIAVASLTKFFPALLLVPLLMRKKWSALIGFASVWVVCIAIIQILHPGAIARYIAVNNGNSLEMIQRADNVAFLPTLFREEGIPGVALGVLVLGVTAWIGRKDWHMWEFLAVALLPIAWIYSLLPVLPGMITRYKQPLIIYAVLLAFIIPPFGNFSALATAVIFLLICLAIIFGSVEKINLKPFSIRKQAQDQQ